jgi:hypothetical protein
MVIVIGVVEPAGVPSACMAMTRRVPSSST